MKTRTRSWRWGLSLLLVSALVMPTVADAQRMKHSAPKSRPSGGSSSRGSINGGAQRSKSRPAPSTKPSAGGNGAGTRQTGNQAGQAGNKASAGTKEASRNNANTGNRTNTGNKVNTGDRNKANIDNSRGDVNINVDNSRNINVSGNNVHRSTVAYGRPPYAYGGYRYYAHAPYHYHPYRPYPYPAYHPWGFFVATLAVTAIVVSVNSQQYHYDQGVYYTKSSSGYTVVEAPVGATITTLPEGAEPVVVNQTTNNYYYGGTYYEKSADGYTVVPPTAGTVVATLPEGGKEERIGDVTYVKVGETYYQPIKKDGKDMYEVVQVEAES